MFKADSNPDGTGPYSAVFVVAPQSSASFGCTPRDDLMLLKDLPNLRLAVEGPFGGGLAGLVVLLTDLPLRLPKAGVYSLSLKAEGASRALHVSAEDGLTEFEILDPARIKRVREDIETYSLELSSAELSGSELKSASGVITLVLHKHSVIQKNDSSHVSRSSSPWRTPEPVSRESYSSGESHKSAGPGER